MAKNRDRQNQPTPPPVADYYYDRFQPVPQVVGEDVAKALPTIGGPPPGAIKDRLPRIGDEPPPGEAAKRGGGEPYGKGGKK